MPGTIRLMRVIRASESESATSIDDTIPIFEEPHGRFRQCSGGGSPSPGSDGVEPGGELFDGYVRSRVKDSDFCRDELIPRDHVTYRVKYILDKE